MDKEEEWPSELFSLANPPSRQMAYLEKGLFMVQDLLDPIHKLAIWLLRGRNKLT